MIDYREKQFMEYMSKLNRELFETEEPDPEPMVVESEGDEE